MDPATLVMASINLVVVYLSRHRDELVDRVGEAAVERIGAVYHWVRDRLGADPQGGQALDGLEQAPDDARRQGAVEFALGQLVARHAELQEELEALVGSVQNEAPEGVRVTDAGAVAIGGDVNVNGTYAAGRDLTVGDQPRRPQ